MVWKMSMSNYEDRQQKLLSEKTVIQDKLTGFVYFSHLHATPE